MPLSYQILLIKKLLIGRDVIPNKLNNMFIYKNNKTNTQLFGGRGDIKLREKKGRHCPLPSSGASRGMSHWITAPGL